MNYLLKLNRAPNKRLFDPLANFAGPSGIRQIFEFLKIQDKHLKERMAFARLYRFAATGHILNQIPWDTNEYH